MSESVLCKEFGALPRRAPESVVGKVGLLLETLHVHGSMSLSALARESGLPKSTVRRLVGELGEWKLIEPRGSEFVIGYRVGEFGQRAWSQNRLGDVIRPFIVDFYAEHQERISLLVPHDREIVVVDRVAGTGDPWLPVGTRAPLHATAAGKTILAFSSTSLFRAVTEGPLPRLTPQTICLPQQLARELREVRKAGYAVTRGESAPDKHAFAVPVFGGDGQPVASLAVALRDNEVPPHLLTALRKQAQFITPHLVRRTARR